MPRRKISPLSSHHGSARGLLVSIYLHKDDLKRSEIPAGYIGLETEVALDVRLLGLPMLVPELEDKDTTR